MKTLEREKSALKTLNREDLSLAESFTWRMREYVFSLYGIHEKYIITTSSRMTCLDACFFVRRFTADVLLTLINFKMSPICSLICEQLTL